MYSTCLWMDDGLLLLSIVVLFHAGMYCKKLKLSSGLRRSSRCTDNETYMNMERDVAREEEMSSDKDDRTEMNEET